MLFSTCADFHRRIVPYSHTPNQDNHVLPAQTDQTFYACSAEKAEHNPLLNMSSLASNLGLKPGSEPQDLTAWYIIINFLWAYAFSSARGLKLLYGMDNQVSPRTDLDKRGPRAVLEGKITQAQLDMLKRNEAAHANSVEHFPLFATALILAKLAGLPNADINVTGFAYTIVRLAYWGNYVFSTTMGWAAPRALLWWGSNIVCFRLIWRAGNLFNGIVE